MLPRIIELLQPIYLIVNSFSWGQLLCDRVGQYGSVWATSLESFLAKIDPIVEQFLEKRSKSFILFLKLSFIGIGQLFIQTYRSPWFDRWCKMKCFNHGQRNDPKSIREHFQNVHPSFWRSMIRLKMHGTHLLRIIGVNIYDILYVSSPYKMLLRHRWQRCRLKGFYLLHVTKRSVVQILPTQRFFFYLLMVRKFPYCYLLHSFLLFMTARLGSVLAEQSLLPPVDLGSNSVIL